jgi:hypothetical protein
MQAGCSGWQTGKGVEGGDSNHTPPWQQPSKQPALWGYVSCGAMLYPPRG